MVQHRILIVDDNLANLKLMRILLGDAGYDVRTAASAEDALRLLADQPPRVILMDVQLPGMSGLELTRKLKADATTRDIVVVAVTAYAARGDEERTRAAGCDEYVAKPVDIDALLQTIARLVTRASEGE
jgi:CheY-like chemotaxis protein